MRRNLDLEGRDVESVVLQGPYFQDRLGNLGESISKKGATSKTLSFTLTYTSGGVFVECTTPGKQTEFLIPLPNIKGVTFAREAVKPTLNPVTPINAPNAGAA